MAGKLDSKEIMKKIKDGNGKAEFTTVAGGKIWASMVGGSLMIWDEKNASARC